MAALGELGLDENTLVVYSADQGWMGGTNGLWGMGDHTRPLGAFDGMMRVPLVLRQPGAIAPGTTSDLLVSNYDFLPSVLAYLGLGDKLAGAELARAARLPARDAIDRDDLGQLDPGVPVSADVRGCALASVASGLSR